jgi:hypothetical protein
MQGYLNKIYTKIGAKAATVCPVRAFVEGELLGMSKLLLH